MGSLLKDSVLLMASQVIGAVLGYLFYIFTARMLGPSDFGVLGALISIFYIMAAFQITLQITSAKYVSRYLAKKDDDRLKRFNYKTLTKLSLFSFIFVVTLTVISPWLSIILKISPIYLFMSFLIIPFMFLSSATRGIFQGVQDFKNLSINLAIEPIVKIIITIALILLGFGLFGALVGIILSFVVPFCVSFIQLEHLIKKTDKRIGRKEVYKYVLPVVLTLFIFVFAVNIDNLTVKALFSNEETGFYSVATLFAKGLFYMALCVGMAMFPKVSELHAVKSPHKQVLTKSLKYVVLGSAAVVGFFALFAKDFITLFYGVMYLPSADYLVILLLAQAIFSIALTIALYNISQDKTKHLSFYVILILFELWLIYTLSYSPLGIAWAVLISSFAFLGYSLVSLARWDKFIKINEILLMCKNKKSE